MQCSDKLQVNCINQMLIKIEAQQTNRLFPTQSKGKQFNVRSIGRDERGVGLDS